MARTRTIDILPTSLPPFGVNREQAAELVGVSPSTFDKMVTAGTMPRPRMASAGRLVYAVTELSEYFRRLPHQPSADEAKDIDEAASGSNPWDDA